MEESFINELVSSLINSLRSRVLQLNICGVNVKKSVTGLLNEKRNK